MAVPAASMKVAPESVTIVWLLMSLSPAHGDHHVRRTSLSAGFFRERRSGVPSRVAMRIADRVTMEFGGAVDVSGLGRARPPGSRARSSSGNRRRAARTLAPFPTAARAPRPRRSWPAPFIFAAPTCTSTSGWRECCGTSRGVALRRLSRRPRYSYPRLPRRTAGR